MRSLTVTLPDDMVEEIEAKVADGEYASASALVCDGIESLLASDADVEDWLRDVVVPSCERTRADPSLVRPIEGVLDRIQRRFAGKP